MSFFDLIFGKKSPAQAAPAAPAAPASTAAPIAVVPPIVPPPPAALPPNLQVLLTALREYGTTEVAGAKHNPRILEYSASQGINWVHDDETAWCGIFAGFVHHQVGLKDVPAQPAAARNWVKAGQPAQTPEPGNVVVFWRGSPEAATGHVSLFIREAGSVVYCLGGNQGNQVNITAFPKDRILDIRKVEK